MSSTSIQWTDYSINPIRARLRDAAHAGVTKGGYGSGVGHYCEKVSPGCAHCYSSTSQPRFGMPQFPGVQKGEPLVDVFFDDARLYEVLRRKAPTKWFWCDQTDMFGKWVPFDWIDKCFAVMALTPQHTHQILTKRVERMAEYLTSDHDRRVDNITQALHEIRIADGPEKHSRAMNTWMCRGHFPGGSPMPLPNAWLGTSVERQQEADERIPHLLRCPAAVRFLSAEPLLGAIDLTRLEPGKGMDGLDALRGGWHQGDGRIYEPSGGNVDWVIVGGESGPGARRCAIEDVRSIVNQCRAADVPVFVKQLGREPYINVAPPQKGPGLKFTRAEVEVFSAAAADELETALEGYRTFHLKDSKGGDPAEWPEDLRVREFPRQAVPA